MKDKTVTYTTSNGSKIGTCKSDESLGKCFEVADHLKGDLARSYFYLSVAYRNKWECCNTKGVDKWKLKPWLEADMRDWHEKDPVTE